MTAAASFRTLWDELLPVGRAASGGYRRYAWSAEDATLREWFAGAAAARGLSLVVDRAGNQWAWWGDPDADGPGVVLGSHLDSVPDGGAFDGPLGVVSAFAALDALRAREVTPSRPVGIVNFTDEEGARFGIACTGSRLLTGTLAPDRALALRDGVGTELAAAMRAAGHDPRSVDHDEETVRRIGVFVELHVEQGRALADLDRPVAVGDSIWPHGRWRLDLAGEANHAGTTRLQDRVDPMLVLADVVREARAAAERYDAVATCGKVRVEPNGVNAIPSHVTAWLDARGPDPDAVRRIVADVARAAGVDADSTNRRASIVEESWTDATAFDAVLARRLADRLDRAPILATGAGHDAGVLALAGVPTAMLFVRNPTGVSHSPAEFAEEADCLAGVDALVEVVLDLAGPPTVGPPAEHATPADPRHPRTQQ